MVAIAEKINTNAGSATKYEENHQTTRIIQWLGGERAGRFEKNIQIDQLPIQFS